MPEPRDAVIPEHGQDPVELLSFIDAAHAADLDWRSGRAFSLVYHAGDPEHEHLLEEVGRRFLHENALNPFKYPTVLQMELELIAMAGRLFGAPPDAGSLSSGGTESIFLAVQVARDRAREERGIAEPQVLAPRTAHPAFAKAAKYLDVELVLTEMGDDGRARPDAMASSITERTGLMVGSAPCYPFGVMDPIEELAGMAAERDILFHTDACLGGWLLPWWERLGESVPPWDFRVPGVTSLSADLHKYGYAFKGASVVMYRSRELLQRQFFWYDSWPGGLYASGTTAGTRPAAPIVGAWAAVNHLGVDGYLGMAESVRDTSRRFREGIDAIDGLRVAPKPDLSVMQFGSDRFDIAAVADVMDGRGWNLDRQQGGLHLMISPFHARVAEDFLTDLAGAAAEHGEGSGAAATYGGVAGATAPIATPTATGRRAAPSASALGSQHSGCVMAPAVTLPRLPRPKRTTLDVPTITVDELAEKPADQPLFDVRQPEEYVEAHVPGARLVPLADVPDRLDELIGHGPVLVICKSGGRSQRAVEYLRANGLDAINVVGGTSAWIESGRAVAIGDQPD